MAASTEAPVATAPLLAGEVASLQDPDLTVRDLKDSPSRLGRVLQGVVTNRGTRTYGSVFLSLDFVDAHGAKVDTGRDSHSELRPGDQWQFRINMASEIAHYKVAELRGY